MLIPFQGALESLGDSLFGAPTAGRVYGPGQAPAQFAYNAPPGAVYVMSNGVAYPYGGPVVGAPMAGVPLQQPPPANHDATIVQEMTPIKETATLLEETLAMIDAAKEDVRENELAKEFYGDCRRMQPRLVQITSHARDERLLSTCF